MTAKTVKTKSREFFRGPEERGSRRMPGGVRRAIHRDWETVLAVV